MFRLLQVGLIGLATSQNASDALGNVKAKMEEYDRNLVLQRRFSVWALYFTGLNIKGIDTAFSIWITLISNLLKFGRLKTNLRKVIPLYANHLGWLSFCCALIGLHF